MIVGHLGSDSIEGGWGRDTIYAGIDASGGGNPSDRNTVWGDPDQPSLPEQESETSSDDTIYGDAGNDELHGGWGNDLLQGNQGSDAIEGGAGSDRIIAGTGESGGGLGSETHTIYGDWQSSGKSGVDGDDTIFADFGRDSIFSGGGNDTIVSFAGSDTIFAGSGNDVVDSGSEMTWCMAKVVTIR